MDDVPVVVSSMYKRDYDSEKLKNLEEDLKGVEINQPPPISSRPEKTKSIYTAPVDEEESDPNALKVPDLAKETISENSTNTGNLSWFQDVFITKLISSILSC